jgi:uncharacterized protein involved in propanediol utilization
MRCDGVHLQGFALLHESALPQGQGFAASTSCACAGSVACTFAR